MIRETLMYTCDRCKAQAPGKEVDDKVGIPVGWGSAMGEEFCPKCIDEANVLAAKILRLRSTLESNIIQWRANFMDGEVGEKPVVEDYDAEIGRAIKRVVKGKAAMDVWNLVAFLCGPDGYSMDTDSLVIQILRTVALCMQGKAATAP
jgi:hypothetical protein